MDLFNGETPAVEVTTTTDTDPIETVKQKFKTETGDLDVQGLAKGKIESDKHITNLESELRGLRQELDTRLNYEQFLEEIKTARQAQPVANQTTTESAKALGKDEIANLVREAVSNERTQAQQEHNILVTQQELAKAWGADYQNKLVQKLAEVGVPKDMANSIAQSNPKALLKLLDVGVAEVKAPVQPSLSPPANALRNTGQINAGKRDYTFYQKLRKSDPKTYWHSKTQQQMHNDMFEQGEEFGVKLS